MGGFLLEKEVKYMEVHKAMKALEVHAEAGHLPTGRVRKFEQRRAAPPVDTHFASNRTQELMFQIDNFRHLRGLPPLAESETVFRADGTKPRTLDQVPSAMDQ